MTDLYAENQKLRAQLERKDRALRVLGERLAVAETIARSQVIENWLAGDADSEQFWEGFSALLLAEDDGSRYKRAEIRGHDDFAPAKRRVGDCLREIIRQIYSDEARAA